MTADKYVFGFIVFAGWIIVCFAIGTSVLSRAYDRRSWPIAFWGVSILIASIPGAYFLIFRVFRQ